MVDETCNRSAGCVDDHLVVEAHEIIALVRVSYQQPGFQELRSTDLISFIDLLHTSFTLLLSNDLTSVFDNNLVRFERPHGSHSVTLVVGFHDLYTIVIAITPCTLFELCKRTVITLVRCKLAVGGVALVRHNAVVASFPAPIFCQAIAVGVVLFVTFPQSRSIADKAVCF
jgi:hypothetical protein